MGDSWESRFGLGQCTASDEGRFGLDKFIFGAGSLSDIDRPPYVLKMHFVEQRDLPFPRVFMGMVRLPAQACRIAT